MDDPVDSGPHRKAVNRDGLTTSGVVILCIGSAAFLLLILGAVFLCIRKKKGRKKFTERPLTLRRPTAVRNPTAHSHYLKKSPSPTGVKSPPGSVRSPPRTSPGSCLPSSGNRTPHGNTPRTTPPSDDNRGYPTVSHESEKDKPSTPSKEELELNEKNLQNKDSSEQLGKIHFKVRFNSEKGCLVVTVVRCTELPSKDTPMGSCDPYVKLQLLPEKQHKAKTRVLRKTCSPEYDEDFTFYGLTLSQLQMMSLHFVVLSFDRYSRDDVIGESITPLSEVDLTNLDTQVALTREIKPRNLKGRGELLVSLCHQPAANRLTVVVLKARNLPKMDITGLSDPYVKIYLLSNGQRVSKKKTHVKKRTLNPVFNESFVFDLPVGGKDLKDISLDFLLLDWDRVTKNEVIGRLELGGAKATGSALHHWEEVVNSPRRQIAEWHKLRE